MAIVPLELTIGPARVAFLMDDMNGLDHVVSLAREHGLAQYEPPYPALTALLLAHLQGDYIDIGANTGLFTLLAASVRRSFSVHAIEPLRQISDVLAHNVALNPNLRGSILMHRIAVSDARGEATFYETVNPYGLFSTSSTLDRDFGALHGDVREHIVPVSTLDDLAQRHALTDIAFIKMDVEGHEAAVMRGSLATIAACRPVIGIELLSNADFAGFDAFLANNGYIDCALTPSSLRMTSKTEFISEGWNHIFLPKERTELMTHCATIAGLSIV